MPYDLSFIHFYYKVLPNIPIKTSQADRMSWITDAFEMESSGIAGLVGLNPSDKDILDV